MLRNKRVSTATIFRKLKFFGRLIIYHKEILFSQGMLKNMPVQYLRILRHLLMQVLVLWFTVDCIDMD